MNLDKAERLFDAGPQGVLEWNHRRAAGEAIPDLREVDLWARKLSGINLSGLRLIGACLCDTTLDNANFRGATLYGANLSSINARGACFVNADLRKSQFGVFSVGLGHSCTFADVSGADFTRARLGHADLTETIVGNACFCEADLTAADLRYTNFSWADTTHAKLDGVIWNDPVQEETSVPFGEWLRAQREFRGMSPEGLAAQIGCGLSGYDITTIMEKKTDGVAPSFARRLAAVFRIAVSDVPKRSAD